MVNVWSVCVGDKYSDEDVYILKSMVERNLDAPHDFYCLSDRQIGDINCLIPEENWPGWWSKLLLFRYAGGQVLYLDLDVVVTGDLTPLLSERLSMPSNWAQSGHGGCQSSVMSWNSHTENVGHIADLFDIDQVRKPSNGNCGAYGDKSLWGDQEFVTEVMGEPGDYIAAMNHVYSYKYHCTRSVPEDCSVVCFHGDPKPAQVHHAWVRAARSFTATAN